MSHEPGIFSPSRFPVDSLLDEDADDVIAVSREVTPELLVDAYSHGIFPWPSGEDELVPWCSPRERALLFFDELRIPASLAKARRKSERLGWSFTLNQAFSEVIRACAAIERPGQAGTWITSEMIDAYTELHRSGHAHSVEVWEPSLRPDAQPVLIGGIYGVSCGGAFSAESMFYLRPNASKLALLRLIEALRASDKEWIDIQQLTPHLEQLGAREIERKEYLQRLAEAQKLPFRLKA